MQDNAPPPRLPASPCTAYFYSPHIIQVSYNYTISSKQLKMQILSDFFILRNKMLAVFLLCSMLIHFIYISFLHSKI